MSENVGFTANQLKFIDWLAHGKYDRSPPTQELFAESIGVHDRTLTRWKKGQNGFTEKQFWAEVTARAKEILHQDLPDIYNSLRDEAKKGSYQHQRMALEMCGEISEVGTEQKPFVVKVLKGISVDDL